MMLNSKYIAHIVNNNINMASVEDYEMRKEIFAEVDAFITMHNNTESSFKLGHNQFSTMTDEEKDRTRGLLEPQYLWAGEPVILSEEANGDSLDWRAEGAVNAIQNQGSCGSCWSFSTMASVEGAHAIATGELVKLAEQQLVDCATRFNNGCNGGSMAFAFTYLKSNDAVTEASYPYTAKDGTCYQDSAESSGVRTTGHTNVEQNSSSQLKAAVTQGVVSVAIQANRLVFQSYSSGIFDSTSCGTRLDHGVALVGYGSEDGQDYWILRNSWGTTWGEEGYMRLADVDGEGICGVNMAAVYPATN